MSILRICLLGTFQVFRGDVAVDELTSAKIQGLLAYLAVESDRAHSRETLAELLWPDRPDGVARQNLRQALTRLRRAIVFEETPSPLLIDRKFVQFSNSPVVNIDLADFEAALEAVGKHQHEDVTDCRRCAQLLDKAVAAYGGDFIVDLNVDSSAFDEWALLKREWLRRESLHALHVLVEYNERLGDYTAAYRYAWRRVEVDSLLEDAHQQVIRALALDGRQSAALAHYDTLRQILEDELGVEPAEETSALVASIRAGTLAPSSRGQKHAPELAMVPSHNLPIQHTAFVGREDELRQIVERLDNPHCHLLTLVGMGGVGKTRLALEVAHRRLGAHRDGVWYVSLASIAEPDQITTAVADAIGYTIPPSAQDEIERLRALIDFLHSSDLLLILDNYEHLLSGTDLPLQIVQQARHVKLLITSRAPLELHAEWIVDVDGLPVPPGVSAVDLHEYAAVQLFEQSAQRVLASFKVGADNATAIAEVCRLTMGLPLAIELAATRVRKLAPEAIAHALRHNLDGLSTTMPDVSPRHRSLRASVDYAWSLLSREEQSALAQISVFRGTFDASAAMAVVGARQALLTGLVARSLVRRDDEDRYYLHEVLRQFAGERLAQTRALQMRSFNRHSAYYLDLVARNEERLHANQTAEALAELRANIDNLRSAWRWAAETGQLVTLDRSAQAMNRFYSAASLLREGEAAFELAIGHLQEQAEDHPSDLHILVLGRLLIARSRFQNMMGKYDAATSAAAQAIDLLEPDLRVEPADLDYVRADALLQRGRSSLHRSEMELANTYLERALALSRQCAAHSVEIEVHLNLGTLNQMQGNFDIARDHYDAGLNLCRAAGERYGEGICLNNLASLAEFQGDFVASLAYLEAALIVFRATDYQRGIATVLASLGTLAEWRGDFVQALDFHQESLEICRDIGDGAGEAWVLHALGTTCRAMGRFETAEDYLQAALRKSRSLGTRQNDGWILKDLGGIAMETGIPELAEQYLGQALAIAEEVGDRQGGADVQFLMGDLAVRKGELRTAEETYMHVLELFEDLEHRPSVCQARTRLAQLAADNSDWVAAEAHVYAAMEQINESAERTLIADAWAALGRTLAGLGKVKRAIEFLTKAAVLYEEMQQHHLAVEVKGSLALAHQACDDHNEAMATVETVLSYLAAHPTLPGIMRPGELLEACYAVCSAGGDPRAAKILAEAKSFLRKQAESFSAPTSRDRFLRAVPANRRVMAMHGSG